MHQTIGAHMQHAPGNGPWVGGTIGREIHTTIAIRGAVVGANQWPTCIVLGKCGQRFTLRGDLHDLSRLIAGNDVALAERHDGSGTAAGLTPKHRGCFTVPPIYRVSAELHVQQISVAHQGAFGQRGVGIDHQWRIAYGRRGRQCQREKQHEVAQSSLRSAELDVDVGAVRRHAFGTSNTLAASNFSISSAVTPISARIFAECCPSAGAVRGVRFVTPSIQMGELMVTA